MRKRTAASLADTPTGRPRRRAPRWVRITFAALGVAFVSRAVYGVLPPTLTPEQTADLDAEARYVQWKTSPEGAGFERLRAAASGLGTDKDRRFDHSYTVLLTRKGKSYTASEIKSAEQEARQLVPQHRRALDAMRESIRQPFALPPWRNLDESAPYLADFRALARLNALDAELKKRDGDTDGAARTLASGMEFGSHLMPGSNLIGRLVGIACQAIAVRPLWEVLPHVSRQAYPALMVQLQRASAVPPVADTIAEEKRLGQRTLLQIFGDKRFGAPYKVNSAFTLTTLVWSRRRTFSDYTRYMETMADLSATPYQPNEPELKEPSDWLNQLLLPVITGIRFKDVQERAGNALVLQAAALYAYRAEHGFFPATLAETAPKHLSGHSTDPFGQDKPLIYRRTGDTFTLYSVGPDGKDDGGKAIQGSLVKGRSGSFVDASSSGDMVGGVNF